MSGCPPSTGVSKAAVIVEHTSEKGERSSWKRARCGEMWRDVERWGDRGRSTHLLLKVGHSVQYPIRRSLGGLEQHAEGRDLLELCGSVEGGLPRGGAHCRVGLLLE